MIVFWTIVFYSSIALLVISLLFSIYEKIRKIDSFHWSIFLVIAIFLMFFSQSKLSDAIISEVLNDIRNDKLVLLRKGNFTKSDLLTLKYSSQKHNFSEEKIVIKVLPLKDSLILKKDFVNNKYWLFYSKYFYSRIHAIGYIDSK